MPRVTVPCRTEQGLARAEHQTIFVNEHRIVVEPVLFGNISKGVYDYVRIFIRAPACVYGHILRKRNLGNLICQVVVAVPADKGIPMPSRNVFCQADSGVVFFPHVGYSTAAIGFKVQRVIGDGRFAAAATAATAATAAGKLRRQLGYIRRDAFAGRVKVSVTAKPHKVIFVISVRACQTIGRSAVKLSPFFTMI